MVSHGSDFDIDDSLLSEMKKQLKLLSRDQVKALCECTLSLESYNAILRQSGHLPR
jgi:hypothetical protein